MHPFLYRALQGRTTLRAPENDQGHVETPPATPAVEPTALEENEPGTVTPPIGQTTDVEARLLKEVMKHKNAAKLAKEEAARTAAQLAAYGDLDPARARELVESHRAAELAEAERRGEYDRIVQSMREQADAERARVEAERQAERDALAAKDRQIDELTVGRSFGDSKFIADNTVLTPAKARRLFGDHFEVEDGEIVAYDKPKGSANRTPLVDARGQHLSFEAAIEKIMKADADFERLSKATLRSGSGSAPIEVTRTPKPAPSGKGRTLIAAALASRSKAK